MFNQFYQTYPIVAAELFSAAWCNLDCKYCYIPKHNKTIIDKHQEIIKEIKQVDPMINRLKRIYGDKLEILSHWGTEPTLTIRFFKDFYKKAIREFPNLNQISMSSNFLGNTDMLVDFIKTFPEDREFTFGIQLSLDGPKWVTDENRRGGATEKITKNMVKFVESVNEIKTIHKIRTHFKPTMSREQYKRMLDGDTLLQYYKFFDDVCNKLSKANKNNKVQMSFSCDPTVVCPDEYTKQDGVNFNEIYEKAQEVSRKNRFKHIKSDSNYYQGFYKIALLGNEFFTKSKMFTCSAGDTQFGISEYLHPCHDTFYMPYSEIKEATLKDDDRSHSFSEAENIRSGRFDIAKNQLILSIEESDKKDKLEYLYRLRGFHDFVKERMSYSVAIIKEMAYCGQVSKCYKKDEMAEILAGFVISRHSCPTGHAQYLGSMHLSHPAYFKLFGNGLVENFLKRYLILKNKA